MTVHYPRARGLDGLLLRYSLGSTEPGRRAVAITLMHACKPCFSKMSAVRTLDFLKPSPKLNVTTCRFFASSAPADSRRASAQATPTPMALNMSRRVGATVPTPGPASEGCDATTLRAGIAVPDRPVRA